MNKSFTVPAGVYFLGDPCYCLSQDLHHEWIKLLDSCDFFNSDEPGTLFSNGDHHKVIAFSTAYGDGTYPGSNGKFYSVDAGLIGLTPLSAISPDCGDIERLGSYITFVEPTLCTSDGETLVFGSVIITTGDNELEFDEIEDDGLWDTNFGEGEEDEN